MRVAKRCPEAVHLADLLAVAVGERDAAKAALKDVRVKRRDAERESDRLAWHLDVATKNYLACLCLIQQMVEENERLREELYPLKFPAG